MLQGLYLILSLISTNAVSKNLRIIDPLDGLVIYDILSL